MACIIGLNWVHPFIVAFTSLMHLPIVCETPASYQDCVTCMFVGGFLSFSKILFVLEQLCVLAHVYTATVGAAVGALWDRLSLVYTQFGIQLP